MESIYLMKSICKKVKLSPFFLLIIFLSLISGLFRDVITLFSVIIIHELGHVLISMIFKWKIKKIDITICGGFITYDDRIDKPFKEELVIAVSGFLFQFILFLLCLLLFRLNIIDNKMLFMINKYNLSILLFNLIPIYPLDGSKIMLVLYNVLMPYKKALKLTCLTSFIFVILIIIYFVIFNKRFEYSYIMIISFVLSKIIKYIKDVPYLFNRLLFERYLYGTDSKTYEYVKNDDLSLFKRRRKHYFLIGKHYHNEKSVLSKRFD